MFEKSIAIDFGSQNIYIYKRNRGVVVKEPCLVALNAKTSKILAYGKEARAMLGRTPDKVEVVHPIQNGVIADFELTQKMLQHFLKKAGIHSYLLKPNIYISCSTTITQVEKNAFREMAERMGAHDAILIDTCESLAIGAGLDISKPEGKMVVDIGSCHSKIGILSMNSIIVKETSDIAGNYLDRAIVKYMRKQYQLLISEKTAEDLRIDYVALRSDEEEEVVIPGKDMITQQPHKVTLSSKELEKVVSKALYKLIIEIKDILADINPELASDILRKGIVLTGGCAKTYGIAKYFEYYLGVPAYVPKRCDYCNVEGLGIIMNRKH